MFSLLEEKTHNSQNLNVSVLMCPLSPTSKKFRALTRFSFRFTNSKTGKISTKMCRSIHHTVLPIILDRLKISAAGSLALTQYGAFFYSDQKRLGYTTAK